jgi:hypothetical protein
MDLMTNYSVPLFIIVALSLSIAMLGTTLFSCPIKGSMLCGLVGVTAVSNLIPSLDSSYIESILILLSVPSEHIVYMFLASCIGISMIFPMMVKGDYIGNYHRG